MRQLKPLILLVIVLFAVTFWSRHAGKPEATAPIASHADGNAAPRTPDVAKEGSASLPAQARQMVQRINQGGPFEHSQDGVVFGNYEGLLPKQPRGYYHEYTVETPGARTRGARRIITGGTPPAVWYYTDDHYRSFHRFEVAR
ncbi:ribonuclease domain-containing protein [Rhodanobacter sp. AS-Z3]|uniref:ribonuclease domain-containing protein n=1 Tax=Rhodanobacter sp. AS-Z3 TaxID=3031330 RepID=UPI00247A819D|nr:ribonuclease domain-containing protein [Rhodanobacter sp. AS-Z3]WEN13457.1 ribonuclease domain-containing protein [Rhodanobacter sp. AS-Z3]